MSDWVYPSLDDEDGYQEDYDDDDSSYDDWNDY